MADARLEAAKDYAARGWAVIPCYGVKTLSDGRIVCRCKDGVLCKSPGKHAVETGWQHTEYREGPNIYPWWGPEAPDVYNIGIRTGAVSGIFAVDVDPDRGGWRSLDALLADGEVSPTRLHKTGSGGVHLIYRLPAGLVVPNSANRLGPGIDVRGEKGYILAPDSVTDKGGYTVVEDSGEVMDPPPGLVRLVERLAQEKAARTEVEAISADPTFDIALMPPHILAILEEVDVPDRSAVLHNFVGQAMRAGFSQAQIVTAVTPWCEVTGKFAGRVAQGVAYSWGSIEAERSRLEIPMPDWFHEAMARRREEVARGVKGEASPSHAPVVDPFFRVREGRTLAQIDWQALFKADFTPEWIVPHLFEVGRNYSVYGGPGVGKSLLLYDFSLQLASGRMTDVEGNPVPAVPVCYFDRENSPMDLYNRAVAMGYEAEDLDELHYFLYPDVILNVREGAARFVQHVVDCGAKFVVIDTLSRFTQGVKENESEWVTDFFNYAVVPLKERGITFVRLDHTGKDQTSGARGTSAKLGDVDGAWLLSYDEKSQIVDLQQEKTRSGMGPKHVQFVRTTDPTSHVVRWVSSGPGDEPPAADGATTNDGEGGDTRGRTPFPVAPLIEWEGEFRPVLQPLGEALMATVEVLDELLGDGLKVTRREAEVAFRDAGKKPGKTVPFNKAVRWRNARIDAFKRGNRPGTGVFGQASEPASGTTIGTNIEGAE